MTKTAFTGLRLSQQVPAPAVPLDQRLFSTPPHNAARKDTRPSEQRDGQEARKLESQEYSGTAVQKARSTEGQESDHPDGKPAGQPQSWPSGSLVSLPHGRPAAKKASRPAARQFDLEEIAVRKVTFSVTDAEFEALEDLKLNLRRSHDLDVPKADLVRLGIHFLLEDYDEKQDTSQVLRRLEDRIRR